MPTQPSVPYEDNLFPTDRERARQQATYDSQGSQWVRDEGYGAPAFGQATVGIFQILLGIGQWLMELGTRKDRAK